MAKKSKRRKKDQDWRELMTLVGLRVYEARLYGPGSSVDASCVNMPIFVLAQSVEDAMVAINRYKAQSPGLKNAYVRTCQERLPYDHPIIWLE